MDGWIRDEWVDGWMDTRWMDGYEMDGWMDGWMVWIERIDKLIKTEFKSVAFFALYSHYHRDWVILSTVHSFRLRQHYPSDKYNIIR